MQQKLVTILGGTGFLGRYVVRHLAREGWIIRVISRNADKALHLKTAGDVGQIVPISGNLADADSLAGKLAGSYAVINLVGVLFESGKQNFSALHAQGAERLAKAAQAAGVQRFVHVSALGVDKATGSDYARTKLVGEKAVVSAFPHATVVRPGVLFGPEDNFYNQFAAMAALSPALPLIGGGRTRLQPVYVDDVARAIVHCLTLPGAPGKVFELGGPQAFTFREILEYVLRLTGRQRMLLPLPYGAASAIGFFAEFLPRPPLTRDQVRLLRHDNVLTPNAHGFGELGIVPAGVDMVVPDYLARFNTRAALRPAVEKLS